MGERCWLHCVPEERAIVPKVWELQRFVVARTKSGCRTHNNGPEWSVGFGMIDRLSRYGGMPFGCVPGRN